MISVIVPVYNSAKSLSRCVDSVLEQSYPYLELLLVNDGSKDCSGSLCEKYANIDCRVRVFHKENGGVSSARIVGLKNALGEWITFVDSDDWLEPNALESLIKYEGDDLILGTTILESCQSVSQILPTNRSIKEGELVKLFEENFDHSLLSGPWSKLFKSAIIAKYKISFNENLSFAEDNVFVKTYLLHTKSLSVSSDLCYHYQDLGDEIYVKYSRSFNPILAYYEQIKSICDDFENKYNIKIARGNIVGVVFEIAHKCLILNGRADLKKVLVFMRDKIARQELKKRQSFHIRMLLMLSLLPKSNILPLYCKAIDCLRKIKFAR